jgi:hypothetical protein
VQVRSGRFREPSPPGGQAADLDQPHADPVPVDVSLEPADPHQLLDHPVDRRLGQLRALGELVQRQNPVHVVERADDAVDPAEHRAARGVGVRAGRGRWSSDAPDAV